MKTKLIIFISLLFILTGCYNYSELNELAIANGISIDYKDNKYIVSILMANSHKATNNTSENQASTSLFQGEGSTIDEAITSLELTLPKKLYLGHVNIIVLDYNYAEKGLYDFFDYATKNSELIKKLCVVISKDTEAYKVLATLSPLEMFSSKNIIANIDTTNKSVGTIYNVKLSEVLYKYLEKGMEFIIPTVTIKGSSDDATKEDNIKDPISKAHLNVLTFSIFKNDKLVDIVSINESKGINILTNKTTNLKIMKDNYSATLNSLKCKLDYKDNKINIKVKFSYVINSIKDIDITNKNEKDKLTKEIEREVHSYIKEAIDITVNKNTDSIGFGNLIYKHKPKYYESIKDDYLNNLDFNIEVKGSLESIGVAKNIKEK